MSGGRKTGRVKRMEKEIREKAVALGKQYGPVYLSALGIAVALGAVYGGADSERLNWLLAPIAWWVEMLSGIAFEEAKGAGYVSHAYRFLIAPSCAGLRFLILVFLMLVFSFCHKAASLPFPKSRKGGFLWLLLSLAFSYVFTVFINGIRIVLAVYLPLLLEAVLREEGFLTPGRLHTMIGVLVYFTSLLILYQLLELLMEKGVGERGAKGKMTGRFAGGMLAPLFWYFFLVLGLPFLGRLYRGKWEGFFPYAFFVSGLCFLITFLAMGISGLCTHRKNK